LFLHRSIFPENAWEEKRIEAISIHIGSGICARNDACDNWSAGASRDTEFASVPPGGKVIQTLKGAGSRPALRWPALQAIMRPVGNVVSSIFANAGIAGRLLEPYDVISGSSADGNALGLQARWDRRLQGRPVFLRVDGDLRGRVEKIDTKVCPLYLLTGEYDFSCTPEDSKRTAAAIAGAGVTIMEQLGHFPMNENPEQFRRSIAPVLNDISKQSIPTQGVHV